MDKITIDQIKHGGFKSLLKKVDEIGGKISVVGENGNIFRLENNGELVFLRKGKISIEKRGDFTKDKEATKLILKECGIKVPKGFVAKSFNQALSLMKAHKLKYPLILKPRNGSLARGVSWNILTRNELKKAVLNFEKIKNKYKYGSFLVEEMYEGDEYRVLVLDKKVISCVKKIPATIIGDGVSSIEQLAKKFNSNRVKGFELKFDKVAKNTLKINRYTTKTVLPRNFKLKLRNNLNMSDGGRSVDCTSQLCKELKRICINATKCMGLNYGGLDLMSKNISNSRNYVILEVNANPYYNMHEEPLVEGKGIDVSEKILKRFKLL